MSFSRSAPCLLERGTLFSRYVTLSLSLSLGSSSTRTKERINGRTNERTNGEIRGSFRECDCALLPFTPPTCHRAILVDHLAPRYRRFFDSQRTVGTRTSKRGRLIIGLPFSLTLSPARRPPTFHPVLFQFVEEPDSHTTGYRDRAIMTTPGIIGYPSRAQELFEISR